jgi:Macrocin-O-methyltransferase (TylF)
MEFPESSYQPSQNSLAIYDDFLARTSFDRLQKILARYELFKMVMDVPGDIVECGVFKGSGLYTLAKLHRIFKPNNEQKIIGFDFFEKQRDIQFQREDDKKVFDEHESDWSSRDLILQNLAAMGISNVELIAGNVVETTKAYAQKNLGFRISLLYLDVDNYEGSLAILENFFPLISPGGVVAFDEYAYRTYGESDAVDEYFRGKQLKLKSFPWANTPTAYIIKERF